MSLNKFLNGQKLPGNILIISIVQKLQANNYIVGDSSCLALLKISETSQHTRDILVGTTVKLIKPAVIDSQTIQTNSNFKPIICKENIKLTPSEEDLSKFNIKTEDTQSKNDLTTFQSIKTNQSQTNFPSITILVTNVSRIIQTNTGQYQIAGIMDTESEKTSINLYDSNIGKLEFGKIYTLTKIKKSMIRKDNETQMRLFTTKFTKISEASTQDKENFENIKLAENEIRGTILGFSDINTYASCERHWNKLDEDSLCPKCQGPPSKVKIDFNTDIYIQDTESEDIKSFLIFKRQVLNLNMENDPELIKSKLGELEGATCTVEYDESEYEDQAIIPKRLKLDISL